MVLVRFVRPVAVGVLLLTLPTACLGGKKSDSAKDVAATTVADGPRPAPNVDPCVLSAEEMKKISGLVANGPGQGNIQLCAYEVTAKNGSVGRLEIRVKPWVTDPGVVASEKTVRDARTAVELPGVGKAAIAFEADPAFKDVPAFVMTNSGFATITWMPGAEPNKDDTKAVVALAKAIAKKLEVPPPLDTTLAPPAQQPVGQAQPSGDPQPAAQPAPAPAPDPAPAAG
jgi:hypothetical protein